MCGRYALALRPGQIRQMFRDDNIPVDEAPDDEDDDNNDNNNNDDGRSNEPRQSYNFAPGYRGVVYRADVPDWGAGQRTRRHVKASKDTDDAPASSLDAETEEHGEKTDQDQTSESVHYKLQAMKWGLIPFWTKHNPGYGSLMKTINCRDDSLAQKGGMWSSMKARKRCIVVAQGFYEWLKKDGGREKIPHYIRRKDGRLMCFAGLWDVVLYENEEEKQYTYTIITTDSNKQLTFLHDRMPVILDNGSENMDKWLDPKRDVWSNELQSLLKPYDGELEVYPVSKEVGKVGNDSPTFIIPINSKENKSNIANFFAKSPAKKEKWYPKEEPVVKTEKMEESQPEIKVDKDEGFVVDDTKESMFKDETEEYTKGGTVAGVKREADDDLLPAQTPRKKPTVITPKKGRNVEKEETSSPRKGGGRRKISATSNDSKSPAKPSKSAGTQKITKFFANSS
ncbi:hypothetical protein GGS21DRAFT_525313 [Xylaria nigripes]|nr:hypothetical protein GGS21DRAFT_525313 [Xylaria nigripes]